MADTLDTILAEDLDALAALGLRRRTRRQTSAPGTWADVDGRRLLNLGSNNYLGLTAHPALRDAATAAVARWGTGSSGSRLTTGTLAIHEELESALADFLGTEAAILFSSGYAANTCVAPALVGKGDVILSDALNHASLIDGCRLSGAKIRIFRHGDANHAREMLGDRNASRRCLVITDGVFSMDGDVAPLPELCDLCDEADAWLMVDDAHGIGVLGDGGRGTVEHCGVTGRVPIRMGTLSKALGAEGAFVAGSRILIDTLRNRARGFLFSTAPASASSAAALAALKIVQSEPKRRLHLRDNAARLRAALRDLGLNVADGISPIIPVVIGEADEAVRFSSVLEEAGVWAPAIRPPSVPSGTARLRVTVMATHTEQDLLLARQAFESACGRPH
jgi:8-amino-7-oxononanoate synthase